MRRTQHFCLRAHPALESLERRDLWHGGHLGEAAIAPLVNAHHGSESSMVQRNRDEQGGSLTADSKASESKGESKHSSDHQDSPKTESTEKKDPGRPDSQPAEHSTSDKGSTESTSVPANSPSTEPGKERGGTSADQSKPSEATTVTEKVPAKETSDATSSHQGSVEVVGTAKSAEVKVAPEPAGSEVQPAQDPSSGATNASVDKGIVAIPAQATEPDVAANRATLVDDHGSHPARNLADGGQSAPGTPGLAPGPAGIATAAVSMTEPPITGAGAPPVQTGGSAATANDASAQAVEQTREQSATITFGLSIPEARGSELLAGVPAFDLRDVAQSLQSLLMQGEAVSVEITDSLFRNGRISPWLLGLAVAGVSTALARRQVRTFAGINGVAVGPDQPSSRCTLGE
jgi:hypothetical protein